MGVHILQLEENPYLAKVLRLALQNMQPFLRLTQFNDTRSLLAALTETSGSGIGARVDVALLNVNDGVPNTLAILEVAAHIRHLHPQTRILLTGSTEPPVPRLFADLNARFVPKPWLMPAFVDLLLNTANGSGDTPDVPQFADHAVNNVALGAMPDMQQSYRHINAKVQGRLERVLRKLADHVRDVLGVSVVAIQITQRQTGVGTYRLVQPNMWRPDSYEAAITFMSSEVIRRGQPVLIEDFGLLELAATNNIGTIGAVAGVGFQTSQPDECGLLICIDSRARLWGTADRSTLVSLASTIAEMFRLRDVIDELASRNEELNSYNHIIVQEMKLSVATIATHADLLKDVLSEQPGANSTVPDWLTNILISTDNISHMLTQLLWLARLDRQLDTVHAIDANTVVNSALTRLQNVIGLRNVQVEVSPKLPWALGHEVWMEEIFANFISNAVKFIGSNNAAPKVRIVGSQQGQHARYEIHDNGVGIPKEHIPLLFEKYAHFRSARGAGSGLGLALVQRIVARLGGRVGVESTEGQGSMFWFTLPAAKRR